MYVVIKVNVELQYHVVSMHVTCIAIYVVYGNSLKISIVNKYQFTSILFEYLIHALISFKSHKNIETKYS